MALSPTVRLEVTDPSGVAPARRAAERLAGDAGLAEMEVAEAAILVSELATNVVRHGGGGSVALRAGDGELVVAAWDAGPGIRDVPRAFADGFSTAGTAGSGLGAVERLAASVDLQSTVGRGTVVTARLGTPPSDRERVDGLALPIDGDGPCGDAFAWRDDDGVLTVLLADGLGHGPNAAEASSAAVAVLREGRPDRDPARLLDDVHAALRHTRGAAVAVARIDPGASEVRFAGIGNITGLVVSGDGGRQAMASHNGTVGAHVRPAQEFRYALGPHDVVVLHSDGVKTTWDVARHPGLLRHDPLTIAAAIVRDAERGRDDTSVLVVHPR